MKPSIVDREKLMVEAVLATSTPVRRDGPRPDGSWGPWFEVLDIAGANLSRLVGGPLLLDHLSRTDFQIGVVEAARIDGNSIIATLRFADNPRAKQLFAEVADGVRTQLSVGYGVDRWSVAR